MGAMAGLGAQARTHGDASDSAVSVRPHNLVGADPRRRALARYVFIHNGYGFTLRAQTAVRAWWRCCTGNAARRDARTA